VFQKITQGGQNITTQSPAAHQMIHPGLKFKTACPGCYTQGELFLRKLVSNLGKFSGQAQTLWGILRQAVLFLRKLVSNLGKFSGQAQTLWGILRQAVLFLRKVVSTLGKFSGHALSLFYNTPQGVVTISTVCLFWRIYRTGSEPVPQLTTACTNI
jgi:hypothetical protein